MDIQLYNKIKEVRGRKLFRALRRRFKVRDFNFEWANSDTAYWNGETMFIKYDISHPLRSYSPEEEEMIREGFAYHEMGHKLYDSMTDYKNWIIENSSDEEADWIANKKWPRQLVADMANNAADGRLESTIVIDYPFTAPYLHFLNYEWAVVEGPEEERGQSKIQDFRELLLRRSLRLSDVSGTHADVLDLINTNQHLIDGYIETYSTTECLNGMKKFIQAIWPTYYEWVKEEMKDPSDNPFPNSKSAHDNTEWGDEDKTENNMRVRIIAQALASSSGQPQSSDDTEGTQPSNEDNGESEQPQSSDGDESPQPSDETENEPIQPPTSKPRGRFTGKEGGVYDLESLLRHHANRLKEAEQEAKEELEGDTVNSSVITTGEKLGSIKLPITERPVNKPNHLVYDSMADENKLGINGLSKVLTTILQPVPDEVLNNARSGRFRANMAWKGVKCDNPQMYRKKIKGQPKGNAYLACMADISGSTYGYTANNVPAIFEIKEALTVILSAAHKVGLPSRAFAFSSPGRDTSIFQLKPNADRFTSKNKGAIGGLSPQASNRDVAALQYLINDIKSRSEDIRIGVMISDGAPIFEHNEGENTISEMVREAARQNIDIICLFVGDDERGYECSKRMYGGKVILSRKSLASDLKKQLVKILAMRRG